MIFVSLHWNLVTSASHIFKVHSCSKIFESECNIFSNFENPTPVQKYLNPNATFFQILRIRLLFKLRQPSMQLNSALFLIILNDQSEPAARSLQFYLQCTDDENRSYRNVCNMSFVSYSLAVIFIIRLFSTSALHVPKFLL